MYLDLKEFLGPDVTSSKAKRKAPVVIQDYDGTEADQLESAQTYLLSKYQIWRELNQDKSRNGFRLQVPAKLFDRLSGRNVMWQFSVDPDNAIYRESQQKKILDAICELVDLDLVLPLDEVAASNRISDVSCFLSWNLSQPTDVPQTWYGDHPHYHLDLFFNRSRSGKDSTQSSGESKRTASPEYAVLKHPATRQFVMDLERQIFMRSPTGKAQNMDVI